MKRTRHERAMAANRLKQDGELVALAVLADTVGIAENVLLRWAIDGRSGVHLDAMLSPERGWLTSRKAYARFLKKWNARQVLKVPHDPRPAA